MKFFTEKEIEEVEAFFRKCVENCWQGHIVRYSRLWRRLEKSEKRLRKKK